jgi:hypothetical protein
MTKAKELLNTLDLFEMSNLRQEDTGLSRIIWVSVKSGRERHGPRIKVQAKKVTKVQTNNWVSVTIDENPRVVEGDADSIKDESNSYRLLERNIIDS